RRVQSAGNDESCQSRQEAHVRIDKEHYALGLHTRELCSLLVAAQGVHVAAENCALGNECIEADKDNEQDEDNGNAVVVGKAECQEVYCRNNKGYAGCLDPGRENFELVLYLVLARVQEQYNEDERQHKAEDYCNYVEVQDPQVHAGEVACGNCLEAGVEGCLCLTLENYLGKSAPHEHAGKRDYERGNAHVGNEVSVKGPDGDPHKECRDNSNG